MAGSCTSYGVRINVLNQVELATNRQQEWPAEYGAIADHTGLRVAPTTGLAWVPPDMVIAKAEATAVSKTVTPSSDSTVNLTDLSLEMVASPVHPSVLFVLCLVGGYQGYRIGAGNFWGLYRYITTYDDGVPHTFSSLEPVGGCENNAGAALGHGGTVEGMIGMAVKPGGTKFKVTAHYQLDPLTFTDSAVNGFTWRPPRLQVLQLSIPNEVDPD